MPKFSKKCGSSNFYYTFTTRIAALFSTACPTVLVTKGVDVTLVVCPVNTPPNSEDSSISTSQSAGATEDLVRLKVNFFIVMIVISLTWLLQGAPDLAVLVEQKPGLTVFIAKVGRGSFK